VNYKRAFLTTFIIGLLAVTVGACGSQSPEEEREAIYETTNTYLVSIIEGDGETACEQLTLEASDEAVNDYNTSGIVEAMGGEVNSCPEVIEALADFLVEYGDISKEEGLALMEDSTSPADVSWDEANENEAQIEVKQGEGEETETYELVKEDGVWKLKEHYIKLS
jgi:polyhydroxyalkanoate synthesis regulator phasin